MRVGSSKTAKSSSVVIGLVDFGFFEVAARECSMEIELRFILRVCFFCMTSKRFVTEIAFYNIPKGLLGRNMADRQLIEPKSGVFDDTPNIRYI